MKNSDNQIPVSKVLTNYPLMYKFPLDKPIFWGPNQATVFPATYNEPDAIAWKKNVILQIPRVARFFFGDGGTAPLGGGGGPCKGDSGLDMQCWKCTKVTFPGVDGLPFPRDVDREWVSNGGTTVNEHPSRWNVVEGDFLSFLDAAGNFTSPDSPEVSGIAPCSF